YVLVPLSILIFFYASATPPYLHSFPTRRSSDLIESLILKLQKKNHTSSIIISHDMNCVKNTADVVVLLLEGKCYIEGTYEELDQDRKSTRLNSSHVKISYAVFCLKKKKRKT